MVLCYSIDDPPCGVPFKYSGSTVPEWYTTRDRERDEKVYPIFKKRTLGGAVSAQGGGKRTAGSAGQRSECGPEGAGEVRRRAGAGSFRHDPG